MWLREVKNHHHHHCLYTYEYVRPTTGHSMSRGYANKATPLRFVIRDWEAKF